MLRRTSFGFRRRIACSAVFGQHRHREVAAADLEPAVICGLQHLSAFGCGEDAHRDAHQTALARLDERRRRRLQTGLDRAGDGVGRVGNGIGDAQRRVGDEEARSPRDVNRPPGEVERGAHAKVLRLREYRILQQLHRIAVEGTRQRVCERGVNRRLMRRAGETRLDRADVGDAVLLVPDQALGLARLAALRVHDGD